MPRWSKRGNPCNISCRILGEGRIATSLRDVDELLRELLSSAAASMTTQRAVRGSDLTLHVLGEHYEVVRLGPGAAIPSDLFSSNPSSSLVSITRTADELSIIRPRGARRIDGETLEEGWRALKVQGPLPFHLVGVLSHLSATLAAAGVSIFVNSTYDTDYVMVKDDKLHAAVDALKAGGSAVDGAPVPATRFLAQEPSIVEPEDAGAIVVVSSLKGRALADAAELLLRVAVVPRGGRDLLEVEHDLPAGFRRQPAFDSKHGPRSDGWKRSRDRGRPTVGGDQSRSAGTAPLVPGRDRHVAFRRPSRHRLPPGFEAGIVEPDHLSAHRDGRISPEHRTLLGGGLHEDQDQLRGRGPLGHLQRDLAPRPFLLRDLAIVGIERPRLGMSERASVAGQAFESQDRKVVGAGDRVASGGHRFDTGRDTRTDLHLGEGNDLFHARSAVGLVVRTPGLEHPPSSRIVDRDGVVEGRPPGGTAVVGFESAPPEKIRSGSGDRCDQIVDHHLSHAFPGPRHDDRRDVHPVGFGRNPARDLDQPPPVGPGVGFISPGGRRGGESGLGLGDLEDLSVTILELDLQGEPGITEVVPDRPPCEGGGHRLVGGDRSAQAGHRSRVGGRLLPGGSGQKESGTVPAPRLEAGIAEQEPIRGRIGLAGEVVFEDQPPAIPLGSVGGGEDGKAEGEQEQER